jgi:hypothetical protein
MHAPQLLGRVANEAGQVGVAEMRQLMFVEFLTGGGLPRYEEATDLTRLAAVVEEQLAAFNAGSKAPMRLVLFLYALEHVARVCRWALGALALCVPSGCLHACDEWSTGFCLSAQLIVVYCRHDQGRAPHQSHSTCGNIHSLKCWHDFGNILLCQHQPSCTPQVLTFSTLNGGNPRQCHHARFTRIHSVQVSLLENHASCTSAPP